jgi:hypothetical protein
LVPTISEGVYCIVAFLYSLMTERQVNRFRIRDRFRIRGETIGRKLDDRPIGADHVGVLVAGMRRRPDQTARQVLHESPGVVGRPLAEQEGGAAAARDPVAGRVTSR